MSQAPGPTNLGPLIALTGPPALTKACAGIRA